MSLDSDPEIEAAFGGTTIPDAAAPISDDPEIHAAFADDGTRKKNGNNKPLSLSDAAGGILSTIGNTALNIPYGIVHSAGDLVRRVSGNQDAPETSFESALHVNPDEAQTRLGKEVVGLIPASGPVAATNQPDETNIPQLGPTAESLIRHTVSVGGDVGNILGGTQAIRSGAGVVKDIADAGLPPKLGPGGIPEKTTAQSVVDQVASKQSGGAAGASANVADASLPLQSRIAEADPKKIDPVALQNHLDADKFGVQLMKGQANRDPIQFSEEQNQSTNPKIAGRINAQNQQITDAIDNIRREASPTNVQNNAAENGQTVVDALKAHDEPIQADINAKYKALTDANGGNIPIDTGSFLSNVDAQLKKNYLTKSVPSGASELLDSLRSGEPLDFEGFEAARSRLAEAQRNGGSEGAAAKIIRGQLEQMPLSPEASNLKGLADQARAAAKARFDALDKDPAYQAAVDESASGIKKGQPSPLADTFLDKYALSKSAPKANVDTMMSKLDDDAKGAVTTHTLNFLRKGAINAKGDVLPNGYNSVIQKLDQTGKLSSVLPPDVEEDVRGLGRVVNNAKAAPPGNSVAPKSGVLVRDALTSGLEHAANAKTGGLYGLGKKLLTNGDKFADEALAPGAGIERQ